MLCIACARPGGGLCGECERGLVVSADGVVDGIVVGVAFRHTGTAVRLVHNLKYRRSLGAGRILAEAMAHRLPPDATVLVPVPRSLVRRVKFGIDQASFLARAVSEATGIPVVDAVAAPTWWRQRAGANHDRRGLIPFRASKRVPDGVVLVDDVLTTGTTLASAGGVIDVSRMSYLVATAAGTMMSGASFAPSLGGDVTVDRRSRTGRPPFAQPHSRNAHPDSERVQRATMGVPDREEHG